MKIALGFLILTFLVGNAVWAGVAGEVGPPEEVASRIQKQLAENTRKIRSRQGQYASANHLWVSMLAIRGAAGNPTEGAITDQLHMPVEDMNEARGAIERLKQERAPIMIALGVFQTMSKDLKATDLASQLTDLAALYDQVIEAQQDYYKWQYELGNPMVSAGAAIRSPVARERFDAADRLIRDLGVAIQEGEEQLAATIEKRLKPSAIQVFVSRVAECMRALVSGS